MAASEMVAANPALRDTRQSRLKRDHEGEPSPRVVQIAGAEPAMMAEAAQFNVAHGAEIIDINMGCPAKKVCNRRAGSALLADEPLVARILEAVVDAVAVPVTLKIRTGPDARRKNAVRIARMAASIGVGALALHGRTREQLYQGEAEHDTLKAVREAVDLPLIGNGDIKTPRQARALMRATGCDAVMIGRGAQGRPWLFREIQHFLDTGEELPSPTGAMICGWMLDHLRALHAFYGNYQGVRLARKHIGWYLADRPGGRAWRQSLMRIEEPAEQLELAATAIRAVTDEAAISASDAAPA